MINRIKLFTSDLDEYTSIVSRHHSAGVARTRNLSEFEMRSDVILTGGLCFSRTFWKSDVQIKFQEAYDGYGISFSDGGTLEAVGFGGESNATSGSCGLILDSSLTKIANLSPRTTLHRVSVEKEAIHKRLSDLIERPATKRILFNPVIDANSYESHVIKSMMNMVHDEKDGTTPLFRYPAALTSMNEYIINVILEGVYHSYTDMMKNPGPMPSPGSVKRAIDYMVENASQPLRVVDIAGAAGVGVRALQIGFMNFKSMTPMAYLRLVRLNGVRAELLNGALGKSVSHVAMSWGFPHMSSFSAQYAKKFGETPSMTLRRSIAQTT